MLKNTIQHWGGMARALHWGMALLLVAQVVLGKVGHEMARSPAKLDVLTWHKSIGVLLLFLLIFRLGWRLTNPVPQLPPEEPPILQRLAGWTHGLLYLLMAALPLSGWVMSSAANIPFKVFWRMPWPRITGPNAELAERAETVHEWLATLLIALVAVHALAALWHHFHKRDRVLLRMLRSDDESR